MNFVFFYCYLHQEEKKLITNNCYFNYEKNSIYIYIAKNRKKKQTKLKGKRRKPDKE